MTGKISAITGKANELITLGMLLPEFPNAMLSAHEQSSHDIIIALDSDNFIRAQVKTAGPSINFTGGNRGGIDRTYTKGTDNPKSYTYSTDDTDVVIGIHNTNFGKYDLYFVPSLVIEKINQKSISIKKILFTKNDLKIISLCKDEKYCNKFLKSLK